MSDPLTALMHAVQVMNLLKTLITKTLRDREETSAGGYSPMSSHSSGHQTETDEEFDSQHDMETSCELRQAPSDYDDHAHFSTGSDEEADDDDIESLSEVEESFSRQSDEDKNSTDMFVEQPASFSGSKMESGLSFTDSKNENSSSASSDGEDSRASVITVGQKIDIRSQSKGWKDTEDDEQTIDKLAEVILTKKSSGSSESVWLKFPSTCLGKCFVCRFWFALSDHGCFCKLILN